MNIWDEAEKLVKQERKYVRKTGLCVDCKRVPAIKKDVRCRECKKSFEDSVKEIAKKVKITLKEA